MDYKAGIVHLSSSDGMLLEIPEGKLSGNDLNYIRSQDVYRKAQRGMSPTVAHVYFSHHLTGIEGSADTKRPGIVQKLLTLTGLRRSR